VAAPLLVVLTGPSGTGKDSILAELKKRPSVGYAVPPNVTTRPPRPGERDGIDYDFVSREEFARLVRDGALLEHATVYGQDKGVPKGPIREALKAGQSVLLRTDIQGARYIKSSVPGAVTIFVAPPSADELERRMRERGGDSAEQVELRLETARSELATAKEFDYVVVNDDLGRCAREIEQIIAAERADPKRQTSRIDGPHSSSS